MSSPVAPCTWLTVWPFLKTNIASESGENTTCLPRSCGSDRCPDSGACKRFSMIRIPEMALKVRRVEPPGPERVAITFNWCQRWRSKKWKGKTDRYHVYRTQISDLRGRIYTSMLSLKTVLDFHKNVFSIRRTDSPIVGMQRSQHVISCDSQHQTCAIHIVKCRCGR